MDIRVILTRLYKALGITKDIEFAKKINVKQSTISAWKNRGTIPCEILIDVAQKNNISLDWLFTGEGSMYKDKNEKQLILGNNNIQINGSVTHLNTTSPINSLPYDVITVVEFIMDIDKTKRKEIIKCIFKKCLNDS